MPCRDEWPEETSSRLAGEVAKLRAMLCAVLIVIDVPGGIGEDAKGEVADLDYVLKRIDYKEAGITRGELVAWWDEHQEADRVRREAAAQLKREQTQRNKNLKRLQAAAQKAGLSAEDIRQLYHQNP